MSVPEDFAVVLVTAPNMDLARRLAKAALEAKLAACANIVPSVESHYWWEGKLESSDEVLLIFKTRQQLLPKLERAVREIHPYDTPEFFGFDCFNVGFLGEDESFYVLLGDKILFADFPGADLAGLDVARHRPVLEAEHLGHFVGIERLEIIHFNHNSTQ